MNLNYSGGTALYAVPRMQDGRIVTLCMMIETSILGNMDQGQALKNSSVLKNSLARGEELVSREELV